MQTMKLFFTSMILSLIIIPMTSFALPPGNYKDSCYACTISGGELNCFCRNNNGIPIPTSLRHANSCGYIKNFNGVLKCTSGWHQRLPEGNYLRSCTACNFDGKFLSCRCEKRNGNMRYTRLDVSWCNRPITNQNGHLTCGHDHRHREALPPGSYRQTCTNCYMQGNILSCQCKRRNQSTKHTSLWGPWQCRGIQNANGNLVCR